MAHLDFVTDRAQYRFLRGHSWIASGGRLGQSSESQILLMTPESVETPCLECWTAPAPSP
jgi:hypothetical protein